MASLSYAAEGKGIFNASSLWSGSKQWFNFSYTIPLFYLPPNHQIMVKEAKWQLVASWNQVSIFPISAAPNPAPTKEQFRK